MQANSHHLTPTSRTNDAYKPVVNSRDIYKLAVTETSSDHAQSKSPNIAHELNLANEETNISAYHVPHDHDYCISSMLHALSSLSNHTLLYREL